MDGARIRGKILLINIILLGVVLLALIVWYERGRVQQQQQSRLQLKQGAAFTRTMRLEPFKLIDINSKVFTNRHLKGHWSLLFFGFTHCQTICPTTLSELNKAYQQLKQAQQNPLPTVIFISVDPERDSLATIKKYITSFNENFLGATGDHNNLKQLTKKLGIMYQNPGDGNEQINHSGIILVINPEGKWAGILTPPYVANIMVQDFTKIQKYYLAGLKRK